MNFNQVPILLIVNGIAIFLFFNQVNELNKRDWHRTISTFLVSMNKGEFTLLGPRHPIRSEKECLANINSEYWSVNNIDAVRFNSIVTTDINTGPNYKKQVNLFTSAFPLHYGPFIPRYLFHKAIRYSPNELIYISWKVLGVPGVNGDPPLCDEFIHEFRPATEQETEAFKSIQGSH